MDTLKKIGLAIFSILLSLGAAELGVRYLYFDAFDREAGAQGLYDRYRNVATDSPGEAAGGKQCHWADSLVPHPRLGVVHRRTGPCGLPGTNLQGFHAGRDIPFERDERYFTILVVGGSVAHNLSTEMAPEGILVFEQVLNRRLKAPDDRPFRVLTGAIGGGSFPHQIMVTALYGFAADAIISVDGYNEALYSAPPSVAGKPDPVQLDTVYGRLSPDWTAAISRARERQLFFTSNWLTKRSFVAFLIYEKVFLNTALQDVAKARSTPWAQSTMEAFQYPEEMRAAPAKMLALNLRQYQNSVRMNFFQAKALGIHYAHFLQPIRWIGKELTPKEQSYHKSVTSESYRPYMEAQEALAQAGTPSFSLVYLFENRTDEIYKDHVHYLRRGYELMAERIADILSRTWGLQRREAGADAITEPAG